MNNNRFKFRVWDDTINVYWKEGTIQLSGDGKPFVIEGNMQPQGIEGVTVEQCTGLKDKNGKLIYEGDVLLFNGSRNPVYFDDGSFVILHDGSVLVPIKQKIMDVFEIIGNIHEMEVENASKM